MKGRRKTSNTPRIRKDAEMQAIFLYLIFFLREIYPIF
jgi:hypothetical protein